MSPASRLFRAAALFGLVFVAAAGETPDARAQGVVAPPQALAAGFSRLDFDDEFSDLSLSPTGSGDYRWYQLRFEGAALAPRSSIAVRDGVLSLTWNEGQGGWDTSVVTAPSSFVGGRSWTHGYFEARMRWRPSPAAWPAFWLYSREAWLDRRVPGAEIDIFEGQGGVEPPTYFGTVHSSSTNAGGRDRQNANNAQPVPGIDWAEWHVYGLLWVEGRVTWYLDGRALMSAETYPSIERQDLFLILGAQAGVWTYGKRVDGLKRTELDVNWVRVWR